MNRRLAIINHSLGPGGAEKLIYDMSIQFKKRNINFSVILLTNKDDIYGKKLIEKGIDVIYLSNIWDIYSFKNIFRLIKVLKEYDIVHTHTYSSQLWTALASLFIFSSKLYITTEHSTSNRRRNIKIFKYIDRWMYSRYNKVISITKATELNLKEWLNSKNKDKFCIINNGIDLKKYEQIYKISRDRIDKNILNSDILICMVGRFSVQKDQKTLIKSLTKLEENYKLILLGSGNHDEEKEMVKDLNLENRVYFLGYRSDVPEIVKACDIAVLSSQWEGFGLAAVESMALGIPTIGSNVDGLKEVLENGGLTFEKGNYQELAILIQKYIKNKKEYKKISNLGVEKSKKYSIEKLVESYLNLYKEEKNVNYSSNTNL